MTDYPRMLEEGYAAMFEHLGYNLTGDDRLSRLEYLADHVFNFVTYDCEMAALFARKAMEVCAAISNKATFDYINDPNNYRWFLLMVNMPFFEDRLTWGTSVRGAWWDVPVGRGVIDFISCGLFLDGKQITELSLTLNEWREFITAVIAFGSPEVLMGEPDPC